MSSKKIALSDLTPCEYNPRKITKKGLERLVASVREHTAALEGWDPTSGYRLAATVTINRHGNRIVGGHQRVEALLKLGQDWIHEDDITWVDVPPGSEKEKALNLSLNDDKAGGKWEKDRLDELLEGLKANAGELYESLSFDELSASMKEGSSEEDASKKLKEAAETEILLKDSLGFVVQEILSKYGETAPQGFIFFAHKNRLHLLVQCNEDLYEATKAVAEGLKRDNKAINEFLSEAFRSGITEERWGEIMAGVRGRQYSPVSPDEIEGEVSEEEPEK